MSETTDRVSVAVARHVRMAMKMVRKARAKWGWTITRIGAWEDQLGLEGVVIEWAKPFSSALAYLVNGLSERPPRPPLLYVILSRHCLTNINSDIDIDINVDATMLSIPW